MGGGGSQTVNQTFNMDVVNKSITETITNYNQSLSAANENKQKMKVIIGNMGPECDVNLSQKIDATSQVSATMEPTTLNQVQSTVSNELTAQAAAAMEKTTEAGNLQFGDKQNMNQEVNMAVENVIQNTFETNTMNTIISTMVNIQDGDLKIENCNGKLDFSQNIVASLMAEAITNALTTNIAENETLNKLAAATEGTQKTENKGVADIVDSIGDAVAGPLKYLIIACVICVCVLVLGAAAMFLSPAGQNMGRNAMKKF